MQFYAFVAPGLEEIAQREITARLGADQQGRLRGVVFFATDAPPQDLLGLGTTEDVFALVARGRVETSRRGLGRGRRTRSGVARFLKRPWVRIAALVPSGSSGSPTG